MLPGAHHPWQGSVQAARAFRNLRQPRKDCGTLTGRYLVAGCCCRRPQGRQPGGAVGGSAPGGFAARSRGWLEGGEELSGAAGMLFATCCCADMCAEGSYQASVFIQLPSSVQGLISPFHQAQALLGRFCTS